nr:hypothetical protein [Tanacetum cinerariifolium]
AFQSKFVPSSGHATSTLALTHILANVEGENATNIATKETPSHTEGEQPEKPIKTTNANMELIEHMDKEELLKKAQEEAKKFEINKPVMIKVVREEAKKIGILAKAAIIAQAGKKEKRRKNYIWTMTNRLKPEPITDIKIHPNTKLVVVTVFRGSDKRIIDVHRPFFVGAFGISEVDELNEIILKKKNVVAQDMMNSLGKRYERLRQIPMELGIKPALPKHTSEQTSSKLASRKRKHMELEPDINVSGLERNRSLLKEVVSNQLP